MHRLKKLLCFSCMKKMLFSLALLAVLLPWRASAASADLGITASSIRFSEDTLYAGQTVRIYASVRNYGDIDVSAKVIFYQGAVLIGGSQTVSVLANGGSDDVYVDYVVPHGTFNIRALIHGQDPEDSNSANDEAITGLFVSISDEDGDGVEDEQDNCPSDANADQSDLDRDDVGDVCDDDRDGDGVKNANDAYPDDASRSEKPIIVVPEEAPVSAPEVSVAPSTISAEESSPKAQVSEAPSVISSSAPEEERSPDTVIPEGNPGIFGFGTLSISPYAQFSYRQIDWRTYEFTALQSEGQGGVTYGWDFGDGATSVQQSLTHAFPDAGEYVVTLAVIDSTGTMVSDAQTFDVSFFHLHNPWIQGTLAALFFVLLGLIWFIVRIKESREEDKLASEEV